MVEPTFGERLTSWLRFVGMKQADLSRALDVSKAAVHGWTTNAAPTVDRIPPICEALGVSVAEFFARMPAEDAALNAEREAKIAREEETRRNKKHPRTGDITREIRFDVTADAICTRCGSSCVKCVHDTEAA